MKKVLSLVLVIAMVLSSFSFAFAAKFEDIAEIDYEEAINTLSALGVITGYEDGTYRPEKTVTRAEMAKLMVELLGYGDLVAGAKSNFADTQGHWADQWIAIAAGRGIVIGTGDGKFMPDGIVTYDQVLTMLVRGLGYTDASNELKNMTWPTNFKVKAAELNITKKVNMTKAEADRGGVAQAMFNALDQQLVKVNSDGDIVKEFTTKGSRTDIPVNLITRIAKPDYEFVVGFEHINPDSKDYAGDKVDLTQYLFQSVEAYFSKNNEDEVVYVGKVNSLTYSDEFESATFKNDKLDELEVGDYTFKVVGSLVSYNNDELGLSKIESEDDLDGAKITVVLDEDETRVKDGAEISGIVIEKASAYVQIEDVYKADATEIDEIYLPENKDKVDTKNLTVKGDATELGDIEVDDIVAAYAPFGDDPTTDTPDKLTLVVARNTVEGEVTGTAKDAYYIDRVKYETNDALGMETLEVGDEGVFYLDDAGKIIAFGDGSIGSKTYAVVYDIIEGEYSVTTRGVTIVSAPKIKLSTAANEKITYEFDVELEKDGDGAKVVEDFEGFLVADNTKSKGTIGFVTTEADKLFYKEGTDVYGNLVSYNLNKSDEITKIEVAGRPIDMKTNNASFVLSSNAIIFNKDGKVIDEDDLGTKVEGTAVYQSGKIVALLAKNVEDNVNKYYAYVSAAYKDQDDAKNEIQRLTAFVKGEKTTTLLTDDKGMVSKEKFYELSINDKGVVTDADPVTSSSAFKTGKVTAVDSKNEKIEIDKNWKYYDGGSATIIEFDEDGAASVISKLSGIKKDTEIQYILKDNVVAYIVINYEGDVTPVEEGKVTYINSTATKVVIDGTKTLTFDSNTEIYDEDGKIVAVGFEDIKNKTALNDTGDKVKDIKVSDGVVVSLTRIR